MTSVIQVQETKIKTTKNPTPKDPPDEVLLLNGLPARELTVTEQEVLRRTLMNSVEIVDEGQFEPTVELSEEIEDNKSANNN